MEHKIIAPQLTNTANIYFKELFEKLKDLIEEIFVSTNRAQ